MKVARCAIIFSPRGEGVRVAEKELDEVGQVQYTAVTSWSCGDSDRASNDPNKIDRLADLIIKSSWPRRNMEEMEVWEGMFLQGKKERMMNTSRRSVKGCKPGEP